MAAAEARLEPYSHRRTSSPANKRLSARKLVVAPCLVYFRDRRHVGREGADRNRAVEDGIGADALGGMIEGDRADQAVEPSLGRTVAGVPVEATIVETPFNRTSVFRVRLPLIESWEVDG